MRDRRGRSHTRARRAPTLDTPTQVYGDLLHEQVEERLRFYESGVTPRKNIDVMREAAKKVCQELSAAQNPVFSPLPPHFPLRPFWFFQFLPCPHRRLVHLSEREGSGDAARFVFLCSFLRAQIAEAVTQQAAAVAVVAEAAPTKPKKKRRAEKPTEEVVAAAQAESATPAAVAAAPEPAPAAPPVEKKKKKKRASAEVEPATA